MKDEFNRATDNADWASITLRRHSLVDLSRELQGRLQILTYDDSFSRRYSLVEFPVKKWIDGLALLCHVRPISLLSILSERLRTK